MCQDIFDITLVLKVLECRKERIYEQKMSDVIVVYFSNEQNLKFLDTVSISSRFYFKNNCCYPYRIIYSVY